MFLLRTRDSGESHAEHKGRGAAGYKECRWRNMTWRSKRIRAAGNIGEEGGSDGRKRGGREGGGGMGSSIRERRGEGGWAVRS